MREWAPMTVTAAWKANEWRLLNEAAPNGKTESALVEKDWLKGVAYSRKRLFIAPASSNHLMTWLP